MGVRMGIIKVQICVCIVQTSVPSVNLQRTAKNVNLAISEQRVNKDVLTTALNAMTILIATRVEQDTLENYATRTVLKLAMDVKRKMDCVKTVSMVILKKVVNVYHVPMVALDVMPIKPVQPVRRGTIYPRSQILVPHVAQAV